MYWHSDRLWYGEPNAISNAIGYAQHCSRSHDVVIRVYDAAGNVIETHEHKGDFKDWGTLVVQNHRHSLQFDAGAARIAASSSENPVSFSPVRTFLRRHYEIKLTANCCIALCSSKNAVSNSSLRTNATLSVPLQKANCGSFPMSYATDRTRNALTIAPFTFCDERRERCEHSFSPCSFAGTLSVLSRSTE
jgi:hypothetical protein